MNVTKFKFSTIKVCLNFFLLLVISSLVSAHLMTELEQAYIDKGKDYVPRTQHIDASGHAKFVNHLILESSPYLLQHAHNPVNWYAFSNEAFNKAKAENKPVFISIGYATCHWCHVMEEQSFDNLEVAKFLNQHFISIKVDREIRPDVDAAYMGVAELLNDGSGGWPLNAILLPNGKAFFAGTYFPKKQLLSILSQIQELWKNQADELKQQANKIEQILNQPQALSNHTLDKDIVAKSIQAMSEDFDELEGGFGQAPKFPQESLLLLLIDEQRRNPSEEKLTMLTTTLDIIASGGIYDVVGGGFHRYSTDNSWLIPHFEKMLYNQAQLSLVYTRAYQLTHSPLYKRIAQQTLDYVLREMQANQGGFFSATDADSEGKEGTFFVWSIDELKSIFTEQEFKQFNQWFDLSAHTDFEGKHIIRFQNINAINQKDYKTVNTLLSKLYQVRSKRKPPLTDHKVLLSWNALMIPSLLEAGAIFKQEKYTKFGIKLANYLHTRFNKDKQLYRVSINDELGVPALFEDYAYLSNAYLSAFDASNDKKWLDRTLSLIDIMNKKFWDVKSHGFNIGNNTQYLNIRKKEGYDGAIPSANAIAYQVFVKLGNRTSKHLFQKQAEQLLSAFAQRINQFPSAYSSFVLGFNDQSKGELAASQTIYDGRIRVNTHLQNNQLLINLELQPMWHINSNQPLQDSLIATKITNLDSDYWTLSDTTYPQGKLINLGFSKDKISIYQNKLQITATLNHTKKYRPPTLQLTLQACSDKVCLAPESVILRP